MRIKRNEIKKISTIIISIFIAFSACFTSTPIKAASYTVNFGPSTGISYSASGPSLEGPNTTDWNANYPTLLVNGNPVFCLDPSQLVYDGVGGYTESDFSTSLMKQMNLIGLHGYFEHGQTAEWYMASQFMMWELRGWTINTTNLTNYAGMKADIQDRINHHYDKPNFVNVPTSITVGQTITLTDTNNVLARFEVNPIEGVTFNKSGNQLSITPSINAPDNLSIMLAAYRNGNGGVSSVVYRIAGQPNQVVGMFNYKDPVYSPIDIKVDKYGSLKIVKQDEDGTVVPNTSFNLSKNADMSSPIGSYTTGADGSITNSELIPGTYFVQETAVPSHLVLDSTIKSVVIKPNETTTYTATNNWIKGYIKVVKKDVDTGKTVVKANTTFSVYKSNDTYVQDVTTDARGMISTGLLRYGDYYLIEKNAPDGYTHSDQRLVYQIRENGNTYTAELSNKRVTGSINITKEDSVTGNVAQGEATLQGAVYELKARTPILDPADGSILYVKDEVVKTLITDTDAKASVDNLYLGDYYVKEKTPSDGYTLDETEYDISITYAGQNVSVVTKTQTVKERVNAQAFSIIKVNSEETGEADNLEGVEFTIKSKKDINAFGSWENAPVAKNAKGKAASKLVTDKNGQAVSDELPHGTYVVRETKAPDDHYSVADFTVVIDKDSRDPQPWRIMNDKKFKAVVAVVKQDAETNQTIKLKGATFKIKNLDKDEYVGSWVWNPLPHYTDSWTTDESGSVMTDNVLDPGNYQLEEVEAPDGYTLNSKPVKFKISSEGVAYETLPDGVTPVITVKMKDTSVKGKITVSKEGEVLTGVNKDKDGNYTFKYEKKKLANAEFLVYAKENIMSADNQGKVIYKKDALIVELKTGADGTATTDKHPLGKYYVKEKTAPDGFTQSTDIKDVTLSYKDQNTELVFDSTSYENERQKIKVETSKKDADTNEYVANAEFTLYNSNDIKSYDNKVLIPAGTAIEKVITGSDGRASFKADLPLGVYSTKETKAPIGYASTDKEFINDGTYKGQDIKEQTFSNNFVNAPTVWEFTKKDITSDNEIDGAKMSVTDKDGNVIDSWISSKKKAHVIKYLHVGETYTLHEVLAPNGYLQAKEIQFTILDTGAIQSVVMKDEHAQGRITVSKKGESLTSITKDKDGNIQFNYEVKPQANAVFSVYAAEDIKHPDGQSNDYYKKDQKVTTLTTGITGEAMTASLPLAKYYVIEDKAPNGFTSTNERKDVELKYADQNTALVYDSAKYENERQKASAKVTKLDKDENVGLKDAIFGLYAKEDIKGYDGKVLVKSGSLIEKTTSNEKGEANFKSDLPLIKYEIKEEQAPIGYSSSSEVIKFDATYQGQDVKQIKLDQKFYNEITKVEVSKTDITTDKELPGNHLTVYEKDDKGNVFDTWVSTDKPHMIKGLEVGKTYILHETSSAYGFAIAKDIEFTISDTGEVQKVKMENDLTMGNLVWNKTGRIFTHTDMGQTEVGSVQTPVWDESNLLGAQITIYAAEDITLGNDVTYFKTDEAIQTLESDWEAVESQKLPVGKYYYVETKTPSGYVPNTDKHYFEIEDNQSNKLQKVTSTLNNDRPAYNIEFKKELEDNDVKDENAYKDVVFGVFTRDDTYDYMGNVAITPDTLVGTSGIDAEGKLTQTYELPVGNYYFKELATNEAYILDENEYDFSIDQSNKENVTVKINDGKTLVNELKTYKIVVNKVDSYTKVAIKSKDFEFTMYSDQTCKNVIKTSNANTEDGTATFKLHYGDWYIKETKAPVGYLLSNEVKHIEINDDGVYVDGKKVEKENDIYSFIYEDQELPAIKTSDDTSSLMWIATGISSFSVFGGMLLYKRKKKKQSFVE